MSTYQGRNDNTLVKGARLLGLANGAYRRMVSELMQPLNPDLDSRINEEIYKSDTAGPRTNITRRQALPIIGGSIVILAAAAAGIAYVPTPSNGNRNQSGTQTPTSTPTQTPTNTPPVIDSVKVWPKYINPTDATDIRFSLSAHDPDNDTLTTTWLIDGKEVSHDNPYVTKLSLGIHTASVQVSDGKISIPGYVSAVTVDPDQIYPTKQLKIRFKGMNYSAGPVTPQMSAVVQVPNHDKMDEQLSTINDELGCNAVSIWAGSGYEDNLIDACEIASQKHFDRIYALAKYKNFTVDEITEKLRNLAPRIANLRSISDTIVWVIGNEFLFCVKDLIPGGSLQNQQEWMVQHHDEYMRRIKVEIPKVFKQILPVIRENYNYPIAYNAEPDEIDSVPWSDPIFESIGWNAYLQPEYGKDERFFINKFSQLKKFGKPVIASEFGVYSPLTFAPADENEQAKGIERYFNMLNRANISGAFYYIYNFTSDWGLQKGTYRKKGFYMYKSYQKVP